MNDYEYHPRRRRRKKRRKSHASGWIVILILFTLILAAVSVVLYLRVPRPRKLLLGTWRTEADESQIAIANAQEWLNGATMGYMIHMADKITKLPVAVDLTLSPNGSYEQTVNETIYEADRASANEALSAAILELLDLRAQSLGKESLSPKDAKALFERVMEMPPEEYLENYGPALITPIDELKDRYERNGKFTLEDPDIIWDQKNKQHFLVNEEILALDEVLYLRIGSENGSDGKKTGGLFKRPLPSLTLHAKAAKHRIIENLPASTTEDPSSQRIVKSVHYEYRNNRYLSLRDMAALLNGTDRQFALSIGTNSVTIETRSPYEPVGGENEPFDLSEDADLYQTGDLKANAMIVDGRNVKYYTFLGKNTDGKQDCYLNLTDFCLMFDLNITFDNGILVQTDDTPFQIDMDRMRDDGFYDEMISACVGDVRTGEILAGDKEDIPVPIASTTKLMSYAVIMDAIANGEINADDTVIISENAAALSEGQDRVIPMKAGQESNVPELLKAMLIASSNESVLALAEHVAGTEEAFVRRMMEKAADLGLSDATVFYNCNGLPVFDDSVSTAKKQNHMSAIDMFRLSAHILTMYPQVTEITTIKEDSLPSLHMDIKTTNALLYNEPDCIGLKTGTTNMARACLVCALRTHDRANEEHDIVAVVLGAEDNTVRFSSGDVLLRYGRQCVQNGTKGIVTDGPDDSMPTDAEGLIRRILSRY